MKNTLKGDVVQARKKERQKYLIDYATVIN